VFTVIGGLGWVVAVIAAATALRRIGAPKSEVILLGLSATVAAHPPRTGPLGLAFFITTVVILVSAQAVPRPAASPARQAAPVHELSGSLRAHPNADAHSARRGSGGGCLAVS